MGNSSSKEKENEAALNLAIDSYNDNALVKFHRFLSGEDKISHFSTFSKQNTISAHDLGLVTGGFGAGTLATSLTFDNSNNYHIEFHNHGTGTQTFNFLNPLS